MAIALDDVDLQILDLMQANARMSNVDLAKELSMAPSAVLERVKKLEQKKVILQYNTAIDPNTINRKLLAFIFIKTSGMDSDSKIAASLAGVPEVQEVHIVAGEDCFLVKVRTEDSASLMSLMRKTIKRIPNVLSTRTTIVLETVKEQQQLVIPKK
jgi:Lrp/AsnC family leucine-responsive transcriptional regulator